MTRSWRRYGRAEEQKSFIVPSSEAVQGCRMFRRGGSTDCQAVREQGQAQRIATIDQDATIIESHKAARWRTTRGTGLPTMVAVWAEATWWWPMSFGTATCRPSKIR